MRDRKFEKRAERERRASFSADLLLLGSSVPLVNDVLNTIACSLRSKFIPTLY